MTKVTWIGEGESDPKEIGWGGHTFKKGEAVEVTDEALLEKARGNKYFKVAGGPKSEEAEASDQQPNEAGKPPSNPQGTPKEPVTPKFPKI